MSDEVKAGDTREARRVAVASAIGTTIEWYDFFIYGTAAALVFGKLFFPQFAPLAGTLAAFGTFAVGFIARPLGGVVMGHFGDRLGRKSALLWSLLLMGTATFAVGLLPTYDSIGIWAPVLLVVLRFIQGFGLGGEWGGAVLMTVEHAPEGRRGLFGSFVAVGLPVGTITANIAFLIASSATSHEQFAAWGWRIPFLVSVVIIAVGLFLRMRVSESPVFALAQQRHETRRMPVVEVLRRDLRTVLLAGGTYLGVGGLGYIVIVYFVSYGTAVLGLPQTSALLLVIGSSIVQGVAIVAFAALSDRWGRRRVWMSGAVGLLVWSFVFFPLVDTRSTPLIALSLAVMMALIGANLGPQPAVFAELFATDVRYSGASLSVQLGTVLGGGLVPFVATGLYAATGSSLSVGAYCVVLALITVLCVWGLRETRHRSLTEDVTSAPESETSSR